MIETYKLPEYCYSGRLLTEVGGIIAHYFSCSNVDPENQFDPEACFNLFCDLNLPYNKRKHYLLGPYHKEKMYNRLHASAHVMIDRDGLIYELIDSKYQAYHAGRSLMNGRKNCNLYTIGVELLGTNTSGFTEEQYIAFAGYCSSQMQLHGFGIDWIQGHDQVRHAAIQSGQSAGKKYDPSGASDGTGDNFDWAKLHSLILG